MSHWFTNTSGELTPAHTHVPMHGYQFNYTVIMTRGKALLEKYFSDCFPIQGLIDGLLNPLGN